MLQGKRNTRWSTAPLGAVLALVGIILLPAAIHAADSPRAVVEQNADRVLAILNSGASEDVKVKRLQRVAYETIDFDTVSRLVLAKCWKEFSAEQRRTFEDEFKQALTLSYSRRIGQFGREKVVILGDRVEPDGDVTVYSKIVGGKTEDLKVNYRLRQREDRWYVIDVIVEGVSIVSSYRTQFQEIVHQGGPARLLAELREKNASGVGLAPEEGPKKSS
jgi:phospholipid transport system substrate-binding protein